MGGIQRLKEYYKRISRRKVDELKIEERYYRRKKGRKGKRNGDIKSEIERE